MGFPTQTDIVEILHKTFILDNTNDEGRYPISVSESIQALLRRGRDGEVLPTFRFLDLTLTVSNSVFKSYQEKQTLSICMGF